MKRYVSLKWLALSLAVSLGLDACSEDVPNARPYEFSNPEWELLTILGDVQDDARPGRWRELGTGERPEPLGKADEEKIAELMALPYLQGYKEAPDKVGVTAYERDRAYTGLNLYVSGHAPSALAMDMEGAVLHEWHLDIEEVWPEVPRTVHSTFWRRVHWYPDGDVLAIFEGIGLVRLDRSSRLRWAYKGRCHHEAFVTEDGSIYVLSRRAEMVPRINAESPIVPDYIQVLTAEGRLLKEVSVLEALESSDYRNMMRGMRARGDIFHTNSIYVFDGSTADAFAAYKKGNVLISILKLNALAIVDPDSRKVVWAASGDALWKKQHDPKPLSNGNLLVFDNVGHDGRSRVLEYDPRTKRLQWQWWGNDDDRLYSRTCGTSTRLGNGNTVVCESDNGRALEIAPDRHVVWEFYNPHRAGANAELIATLFELERVDKDYFPWLHEQESAGP